MTILTLGSSPYLLTRNGRINRDVLCTLKKSGHKIGSIVWNHDVEYFLPNEAGVHPFDLNGEPICRLFPFLKQKGEQAAFTLEVLKSTQPQVIVSVCDYSEISYLAAIKAKYRNLFKWVAIVPLGSNTLNELYRYDLEMADAVITTTGAGLAELSRNVRTDIALVPYGPDLAAYGEIGGLSDDFNVLWCGKNDQMSNPGAFIKAISDIGIQAGMHYNHSEEGDFDIPLLLKRHGLSKSMKLPQKYVSNREGIEDYEMNQEYNKYHVIVDCSSQSATGLSMLEAMATGCIPVGMNFGAVGEIIANLPEEFRFFVTHEIFTGPREEEHAVISTKGLSATLKNIQNKYADKDWLTTARQKSKNVAEFFTKDNFSKRVNEIIENVIYRENAIIVDSF